MTLLRHMWGLFFCKILVFRREFFPKTLTKSSNYIQYIIYILFFGVRCVRVISGMSRGRKLVAPKGLDTRPTTDRVKESMFNLIIPYIPAKNVLDLFAGSGALGIEALSRGSEHCVFVDAGKEASSVVKQNLDLSKQTDKAEVFSFDSLAFLNRTNSKFDLIFIDPPYNKGLLTESVRLIYQKNLLSENGIIVVESEAGGEIPPGDCFNILKQARYGKTTVFVLAHTAGR